METKNKHDHDKNGTPVDAMKYRSMIGSSNREAPHEVKRIFRYLRGTVNMGLSYTNDSGFELIGFSNADHVGCQDSFKSTSGETQFLGEKLTDYQLAKIFTKALLVDRFNYLVCRLGMRRLSPQELERLAKSQ
ncbi:hypothetical protein Tco_0320726 [Tanacetum coccineum]